MTMELGLTLELKDLLLSKGEIKLFQKQQALVSMIMKELML